MSETDGMVGSGEYTYRVVADLAVDRHGDVYVGEVSWTAWQNYTNPGEPVPPALRSLQKLVRVPR